MARGSGEESAAGVLRRRTLYELSLRLLDVDLLLEHRFKRTTLRSHRRHSVVRYSGSDRRTESAERTVRSAERGVRERRGVLRFGAWIAPRGLSLRLHRAVR